MTASSKSSGFADKLKWIFATVCVVGAGYANSYFNADFPMLYRFIGILVVVLLALFLVSTTKHGSAFIQLAKEARQEMRKVVWPTKNETLITSGLVVVVVVLFSLVLWGVDTILRTLISGILG